MFQSLLFVILLVLKQFYTKKKTPQNYCIAKTCMAFYEYTSAFQPMYLQSLPKSSIAYNYFTNHNKYCLVRIFS